MHARAVFPVALAFTFACGASAQTSPSSADALKPLQFLLGTWTAEAEMAGAGKISIERSYANALGGKFLYQTEVMRFSGGEVTREMWMGVDPAKQALAAWAFSSDGSHATLAVTQTSGDTFVLEGRLVGGGDSGVYRSTLQRNGSDRYTHTIEAQKDGAWTRYAAFNFQRATAASADGSRVAAPAGAAAKSLEWLAGNWRAEGEADGVKYAVDYENRWTLGGHFLRSDYSVTTNGQRDVQAAALLFHDSESNGLRQVGFRADGSISTMKVVPSASSILIEGEMATAMRRTPMRTTFDRHDTNSISVTTETQRADGVWRRSGAASFKRRP